MGLHVSTNLISVLAGHVNVRQNDVRLYLIVRVLLVLAILLLLVLRTSRYTGTGWLFAALAGEAAMMTFERLDHQVFAATGGLASGHNIKHLFVGVALACVFTWLVRRRRREPAGLVQGERRPVGG